MFRRIFILLILLSSNLYCGWYQIQGTDSTSEQANSIQKVTDSTYIVAGRWDNNILLEMIDINGNVLWQNTFSQFENSTCNEIKTTLDNGFILIGTKGTKTTSIQLLIVKTDSSGNLEWFYEHPDTCYTYGNSIIQCYDSGYVFTGMIEGSSVFYENLIHAKIDADGNSVWFNTYDFSNHDYGVQIISNDSTSTILGSSNSTLFLMKTSYQGNPIWVKHHNPNNGSTWGHSFIQLENGQYISVGQGTTYNSLYLQIIKYSPQGDIEWWNFYQNRDNALDILSLNDGNLLISGNAHLYNSAFMTLKIDTSGSVVDKSYYYGKPGQGMSIVETPDSEFILAGYRGYTIGGVECRDIVLIKSKVHDIGIDDILVPSLIPPMVQYNINSIFSNYGDYNETLDVNCKIYDSINNVIYDSTISCLSSINQIDTVCLGSFSLNMGENVRISVSSVLSSDQNSINNMFNKEIITIDYYYWDSLPPLPEAKIGPCVGYYYNFNDTKLYILGGDPSEQNDIMYIFDFNTTTWSTPIQMPCSISHAGCVNIDNNIYLLGGYPAKNEIWIFNTETESFTQGPNLIIGTEDPLVASSKMGRILIAGGYDGQNVVNTVQIYDLYRDSVYEATPLPEPRMAGVASFFCEYDDMILIALGIDSIGNYPTNTYIGDYNYPYTDSIIWQNGPEFPGVGCENPGFATLTYTWYYNDPHLYIYGGFNSIYLSQSYRFHDYLKIWEPFPTLPDPARSRIGSCGFPLKIHNYRTELCAAAVGGYNDSALTCFHILYTNVELVGVEETPPLISNQINFNLLSSNIIRDHFKLEFNLPYSSEVTFYVFDISGRKIYQQGNLNLSTGIHYLDWNLNDSHGEQLATGVYFFLLEMDSRAFRGKFTVIR